MTAPEFIRTVLRPRIVAYHGNQSRVAKQLGISPQYLSDVLRGKSQPSARLAFKLGYRRVQHFEKL